MIKNMLSHYSEKSSFHSQSANLYGIILANTNFVAYRFFSDLTEYVVAKVVTKSANLVTNNTNTVSFVSEIAAQCPTGYEYVSFSFDGANPTLTWVNAIVSPNSIDIPSKSIGLCALSAQTYTIYIVVLYRRAV